MDSEGQLSDQVRGFLYSKAVPADELHFRRGSDGQPPDNAGMVNHRTPSQAELVRHVSDQKVGYHLDVS